MEKIMKKVMILGAGNGQMPLINICKKRGYEVIVVSIVGDYPGFYVADKVYNFDTRDKESILAAAEKEKIDAIMTDQTDVAVPTVAYVAEKLGLRGIGVECAEKFTNKVKMRDVAKEAGLCSMKYASANNCQDACMIAEMIGYPVMMKPVDSSGSRGVVKCLNKDEIRNNFEKSISFSAFGEVIIEEYINGIPYMVNGIALGKYFNLDYGKKEYFEIPQIYLYKTIVLNSVKSNQIGKIEKSILDCNYKLVNAMGLKHGLTHGEFFYCPENNKIYLIEIAARGGGTFISSDLTPLNSGVNTNELMVDYFVEGIEASIEKIDSKVSGYIRFALPKGIVTKVEGADSIKQIKGVYKAYIDDVVVGLHTKETICDTDIYGPILLMADSEDEFFSLAKKVKDIYKVYVQTDKGIKPIIW